MESPFATQSKTTTMYLEPYLNPYWKEYQNIITVNRIPNGPLRPMVRRINQTKMSEFQTPSVFSNDTCLYALTRYPQQSSSIKDTNYFMTADDIPDVFSYLIANGYTIDTDLTKMMNKSEISMSGDNRYSGNRRMICIFHICAENA